MLSGRRVETPPNKHSQPTIPQIASRKCYHKILWHSFKSNSPRNRNNSNSHVPISCHTLLYLPVHFTIPQVWILSSVPTGLGLYYKNMDTSEMTLIDKFITKSLHQYLNYNNTLTCFTTIHSNSVLCAMSIVNGKIPICKLY